MERYSGRLLQLTAVGHIGWGLVWYWSQLPSGIGVNTISLDPHHFDREAAFFFLLIGPILWFWGAACHARIQHQGRLPAAIGWQLFAIGAMGCLVAPVSGFWLAFPQAFIVLKAARGVRNT